MLLGIGLCNQSDCKDETVGGTLKKGERKKGKKKKSRENKQTNNLAVCDG